MEGEDKAVEIPVEGSYKAPGNPATASDTLDNMKYLRGVAWREKKLFRSMNSFQQQQNLFPTKSFSP